MGTKLVVARDCAKAIKTYLGVIGSTPKKWLPAVIVLLLELITITPLCGFLFQCGCDWPWFGLDEKCNIYQQNIAGQCPWCVSMLMGVFSTVLAIASGVLIASASMGGISVLGAKQQFFIRIVLGLSMYVAVAGIMAVIAALII